MKNAPLDTFQNGCAAVHTNLASDAQETITRINRPSSYVNIAKTEDKIMLSARMNAQLENMLMLMVVA